MKSVLKLKKSHILTMITIFIVVMAMVMFSFGGTANKVDDANDNNMGYVLSGSPGVIFETSLSECYKKADFVVKCKVASVGEPYLADGYTLNKEDSFESVKNNIRGIRTPVMLEIKERYKGGNDIELIHLDEYYGTYNGHTLESPDIKLNLAEGNEYILFISKIDNIYYILSQPSVLLNVLPRDGGEEGINYQRGFVSLFSNELLFEDYSSTDELIDNIKSFSAK